MLEETPRIPVYFDWIDTKMVVIQNFTRAQSLPRRTGFLSINQRAAQRILHSLLPYARDRQRQ